MATAIHEPAISVFPAAVCHLIPEAQVEWDEAITYTLVRRDQRVTTDVSPCTAAADWETVDQANKDLYEQAQAAYPATARYEPPRFGWSKSFAWELDGGGGAIDRFVIVKTAEPRLVAIVANRHSPGAEDDNLTRQTFDMLVQAALEKMWLRDPLPE